MLAVGYGTEGKLDYWLIKNRWGLSHFEKHAKVQSFTYDSFGFETFQTSREVILKWNMKSIEIKMSEQMFEAKQTQKIEKKKDQIHCTKKHSFV